jgi:hypothetical protein
VTHTFEIIFDAPSVDVSIYPERTMQSNNSIVVDSTSRHIIPVGKNEVMLKIDKEYKTYRNVFSVCPYVYNEY